MLRLKSVEEYTHSCYETNVWRACLLLAAGTFSQGSWSTREKVGACPSGARDRTWSLGTGTGTMSHGQIKRPRARIQELKHLILDWHRAFEPLAQKPSTIKF